ncbi:MAG: hypothetical protein RBG13Loki_3900 [Promethearchaeota archaeon CR_4]|nr:MAG: hypothetical protein RBG13Loki_3900 [Candidatus Lokiarchaeota archaeon CR_4]
MKSSKKAYLNSKSVAFVGVMGALSAVLSFLSLPMFKISAGVSIDFSHIGTFIVAIGGGAILGAIGGAVAAVIPAFFFANPAFIPGKLLTGFCVGAIYALLRKRSLFEKKSYFKHIAIILAGVIGYIPEAIFTYWDLTFVVHMVPATITIILIKAWIEIPIISVITMLLYQTESIKETVKSLVGNKQNFGMVEYAASTAVILISMLLLGSIFMIQGGLTTPDYSVTPEMVQQALLPWVIVMLVILALMVIYILVKRKLQPK